MAFHRNTFADLEDTYVPRVLKDELPDQVDFHETRNRLENDREDKYVNPNLYGIAGV